MTPCVVSGRSIDDMKTLVWSTFDDTNFAAANDVDIGSYAASIH